MKPGIYQISNEEYHKGEGISRSGIMALRVSPYHYWHEYIRNGKNFNVESTPAVLIGSAVHAYILEPEKFKDLYFVGSKPKENTKAGIEAMPRFIEELGKREIVSESQYELIEKIGQAFIKHELTNQFLKNSRKEESIFWKDPATNILCKTRPDIWLPNMLCDIKTAADACPRKFQSAMVEGGYHIQAAMMIDGVKAITDQTITEYVFLVIEKTEPFAIAVYMLDAPSIERGRQEYRQALLDLREYEDKQSWPSYKPAVISLPAYY